MREDYQSWLEEQKYASNTQAAQIHRIKKVEEYYGNLDDHFIKNTYQNIISNLEYSTSDERINKPNPSKINFKGNIRNNLQSYKNAVVRYKKFLNNDKFQKQDYIVNEPTELSDIIENKEESVKQRISLERDMQVALRENIANLEHNLKIIDDGAERAVNSGLIDITCEDDNCIVVIELKAGKTDNRVIGQILGYMGDLQEEDEKPVRGIIIAHDFDKRTKAAARAVPTLTLKKYSIEFTFKTEN